MRKKHFNILILVPFLAMIICSCKDDYPTNRYPLTKADKQMIPYKVGDTVLFAERGQSEPVILIVTKDSLEWWDWPAEYEYAIEQQRCVGLRDCQRRNIYLRQSVYPTDQRVIQIEGRGKWDGNAYAYAYGLVSIRYDKKGRFFVGDVTYEPYNRPTWGPWHQEVLDSLRIGDHVYYDVLRKTYSSGSDTLLYNKAYGVLRIVENGVPLLTRVL